MAAIVFARRSLTYEISQYARRCGSVELGLQLLKLFLGLTLLILRGGDFLFGQADALLNLGRLGLLFRPLCLDALLNSGMEFFDGGQLIVHPCRAFADPRGSSSQRGGQPT